MSVTHSNSKSPFSLLYSFPNAPFDKKVAQVHFYQFENILHKQVPVGHVEMKGKSKCL
ncbi:hypothetical protein IscW_ISCW002858 [Ixodes scapularis]|uniref:Uncharacterized protein n=1 Tax=Ixodes scapularis TaxID=6945 RepID=B7P7N6_IXOSC|nr:hypothetical protein IscW_ISCW002858 [Ixodes scapularis]|eukprot:XP_002399405.1 hypothetical protein IscW_ISCW002858 [Ixodes scapularis]